MTAGSKLDTLAGNVHIEPVPGPEVQEEIIRGVKSARAMIARAKYHEALVAAGRQKPFLLHEVTDKIELIAVVGAAQSIVMDAPPVRRAC